MPTAEGGSPQRQSPARRKMFKLGDEAGLTDEEQIELAAYFLRRDITSRGQLDDHQVLRMLDAYDGYFLITELLSHRQP